jgi:hypothetical protein
VKQTRIRLALLAVIALIALPALLPATASAANHTLGTGKVVVSLDPFVAEFVIAQYPFYPIAPASIAFNAPGPRVTLPITGGVWKTTPSPHGTFFLKGGLVWVHYATGPTLQTFSVPGWRAGVNTTAGWTGILNGTRTAILDENLMGSHASFLTIHGHKYVKVTTVILTYNTAFATAFNTAFGTSLNVGEPFGTATLLARLK